MPREVEAILHCKKCGFAVTLYRVPTQNEGVYTHETEPKMERGCCPKCGGCNMVRE